MKQPYMTGLTISHLSAKELEYYRSLPVPKKPGDLATLAPQHYRNTSAITTHKNNLYPKAVADRWT
jgi:hypothetical protein